MTAGPLTGYRIIELKGIGPGPYAGMLMADMGAEVVVIERSNHPSSISLPSAQDIHSRGKKSIALNLKCEQGREVFFRLVASSQGLLEGFRPGVAERLGIAPADCWAYNSALVYGRITGWGQTGPMAQRAGHDINYLGLSGVLAAIGPTSKPAIPLNLIGDYAGGSLFLVMGMLAAMLSAQRSGKGQVVDAAITDGCASLMSLIYSFDALGLWSVNRAENLLDGAAHFYDCYQTADAKFMAVGPIEPQFYQQFLALLGLETSPSLCSQQPDDWAANKALIEQAFKTKTQNQWCEIFAGTDACVSPVLDYREAWQHPHHRARQTFQTAGNIMQPGPAPRFEGVSGNVNGHRPAEGEDGKQVLAELGYGERAIETLLQQGVVKL